MGMGNMRVKCEFANAYNNRILKNLNVKSQRTLSFGQRAHAINY